MRVNTIIIIYFLRFVNADNVKKQLQITTVYFQITISLFPFCAKVLERGGSGSNLGFFPFERQPMQKTLAYLLRYASAFCIIVTKELSQKSI